MDLWANYLLREITLAMREFSMRGAACLQKYDLTPAQYYILNAVHENGKISQQEIADGLNVTKGNISQIVKVLERKGLITRAKEKKSQYLHLTQKAIDTLKSVIPEQEIIAEANLSKLTPEEVTQLKHIVHKLYSQADRPKNNPTKTRSNHPGSTTLKSG